MQQCQLCQCEYRASKACDDVLVLSMGQCLTLSRGLQMWRVKADTDLAACRSCAVLVPTGNVIVVCEEVGVALVAEGQAQNGLGVLHSVSLAV